MPTILQWVVALSMITLIYFGYIHGFIRQIRSEKIRVGMTEKEVKRLVGTPIRSVKKGHKVVETYKFRHANRLSEETVVKLSIVYDNGKVCDIYR